MAETVIILDDGNDGTYNHGESVEVAAAVKEILQSVLSKSRRADIQVSIKSTKTYQNSTSESWFYIKVTSRCPIDRHHLEGYNKTPALHSILGYMQSLENESHLCIQTPCHPGEEGQSSLQQNLILEGERLNVLNEVQRSKKIEESILYLRIHDSMLHMMRECTCIHSYMSQIRVFRPKADLRFTMKIGEAVSQTDFRIESWRKLSQCLPSVVTDAAFYLQDSDMTAVYDTVVPCTIDPVWTDVQVLTSQNVYMNRSVYISTVALYIPVEQSMSSLCTLTFYGPGCLPLDVTVVCPLLAGVDWSRFKLKVDSELLPTYKGLLPHHTSVGLKTAERGCDIGCFVIQVFILLQFSDTNETSADYQEMNQNMASLLRECTSTMISVIQKITDKLLQPVVNKAKNRDIVMRSISGICKAVTDIVSMSSNEQFRTATLQYMKVKDTVELGVEMNCKLTEISQRKHAAVWTGSQRKYSSNSKMVQELQSESKGSQDSWFDAGTISDAVTSDKNTVIDQTDCTGYADHGDRTDVHGNRAVEEQQDDNGISDINRDSIIITDQTINTCLSSFLTTVHRNNDGALSDIDKQTGENCVSRLESKGLNQNKTLDIQMIIEDMEKVSPFQQLVMENNNACMDITPDLMLITQGMKDVSPFQQVNEDDQVNSMHAEISIEDPCPLDSQTVPDRQSKVKVITPDLVHVIQGMKDVSPFQQLACDDQIVPASPNISTEDPCLSQQVHDIIPHCPVITHTTERTYLNKGKNYVNNVNHKQYISHNSSRNQRPIKFETSHNEIHSDSSQRTSKIPKLLTSKTDKTPSNLFKTDLQESDLEILKSDDFGATLEVVTEFIDEMKCMDEFQAITDQTEETKYGTAVKDKQNVNTAEKFSHVLDTTQNSKTEDDVDNNRDISKEDDNHDKATQALDKQTGRDKNDVDDWFNDVLLEVGEWFD